MDLGCFLLVFFNMLELVGLVFFFGLVLSLETRRRGWVWDGPGDRVVVEKRKEEEVEVGGREEEAGFLGRFVYGQSMCVLSVCEASVFLSPVSSCLCFVPELAGLLVCWFVGLLVCRVGVCSSRAALGYSGAG